MIYLLGSGWELDSGLSGVGVVGDDDGRVARGLGEFSAVSVFHLDSAASGSFGHVSDGEDVANVEGGLFTAIDGLARGSSFSSHEKLLVLSEFLTFKRGSNCPIGSTNKPAHSFQPICGFKTFSSYKFEQLPAQLRKFSILSQDLEFFYI